MDINLITLITLSAMFLTMITGLIAIIKFLFSLKDEISKLNSKFDRLDERQTATKEQLTTTNQVVSEQLATTSRRIDKLEADFKEQIIGFKELTNKFFDFIPKPAL